LGAWRTKHLRGARREPLYSYFWFPSRTERAILLPYVKAFSKVAQRQMELAVLPTAKERESGGAQGD
jgi:hypothetical protein